MPSPSERAKKYRDEHQCSLQEAVAFIKSVDRKERFERLKSATLHARDMVDLKDLVYRLIEEVENG